MKIIRDEKGRFIKITENLFQFKRGNIPYNKGQKRPELSGNKCWLSSTKGKTLEEIYGKEKATLIKKKLSKMRKGKSYAEIYGDRVKLEKEKRKNSETLKKRFLEGSLYVWNKGLDKSDARVKKYVDSKIGKPRPDISIRNKDPKYIKKCLKALYKRPTSFEQKISYLCFRNNLPFTYKGNGDFFIRQRNPDFIDKEDNLLIEVFFSWFKIRDYGSVENYKKISKQYYKEEGWDVIFIDENDLNRKDWQKHCLGIINNNLIKVKLNEKI